VCTSLFAPGAADYSVSEEGNALELNTPWGKKVYYGSDKISSIRRYRIEIPLSSIKPAPPPPIAPAPIQAPAPREPDAAAVPEKKEEPRKIIVEYDESDRLILEANRLYNRGKYFEATTYVDQLLRKKPDYARGWIMKGSLMFVQKQNDLAKKAWEKALELEPENGEVKAMLDKLK